jgi:hypothetical protein
MVRQRQRELDQLRQKLSRESAKIGPAHEKAAKARSNADRTKSDATRKSRLSEAGRQDKKAGDAEKERAKIEGRIAAKAKELDEARRKYDVAVEKERKQALDRMNASINRSEELFHPSSVPLPETIVAGALSEPDERWDVFISHASEDKDDIARPLAEALQARGLKVWFDELNIAWGQSIRRAIEKGIANASYGLVIVSPTFILKHWTQAELDALYGRQMGQPAGQGVILPLWHRVTADDVQQHLPMIVGLKAINTSLWSIEQIADEVAALVQGSEVKA